MPRVPYRMSCSPGLVRVWFGGIGGDEMNPHFASLVLGLSQQAEAALGGELPAEVGPAEGRNLAQALIDTLGMLADKTAGGLDPDEKQLLDQALTSLRFRFVQTMPKA